MSFLPSKQIHRYYNRLEPIFKARHTQAYLMITLSLFTISFFGIFAIRPTLKTIATLQKQIIDQTMVNQKLDAKINSLIQAQESYQQAQADIPLVFNLLPNKPEFPSLLKRLENVTIDSQVTISGLSFNPVTLYSQTQTATVSGSTNKAETVSMPFTLGTDGNYQKLTSEIDRLTKLDRLVTIESAGLTGGGQKTESKINLSLMSKSYYFPTYDKK